MFYDWFWRCFRLGEKGSDVFMALASTLGVSFGGFLMPAPRQSFGVRLVVSIEKPLERRLF